MFREGSRNGTPEVCGGKEGHVSYGNLEWHYRVEWERREDMRRDVVRWRLLKQVERPSMLTRQGCRLLCELGRWMVQLGQQLQQYGRYEQRPFPL